MEMSLYRCSACGSANVMVEQEKEGYSFAKGAVGVAALGVGGAVAGINGKSKKVYKCPDCGLTMNRPMPFELQTLIDIGVMDAKARDNLMLAGVKIEWQELKNRYKNIESGFADNQVVESKVFVEEKIIEERNMLEFCARATKEEFDWAEDILNSNSYEKIKSKEEYLDFVYASGMYIENLFRYRPEEFRHNIVAAICDSIVFSFYDARKELISGDYFELKNFFKNHITTSPFYRQFVKAFFSIMRKSYMVK